MSVPGSDSVRALPRWLVGGLSAAIAFHLASLLVLALAVPSGPWPSPMGAGMANEPAFARAISEVTTRWYLAPLKLTHNYHFTGNRPVQTSARFEVRLKDASGSVVRTLLFPEPGASFWVRHRQTLLAQALTDDQPVAPRGMEVIAAPNQAARTVDVWAPEGDHRLRLRPVPEHLLPRDRPVFRPSEWSQLLARSYVRHLCRSYGAVSGELVRHTREAIPPSVLGAEELPAEVLDELISSFGELPQ